MCKILCTEGEVWKTWENCFYWTRTCGHKALKKGILAAVCCRKTFCHESRWIAKMITAEQSGIYIVTNSENTVLAIKFASKRWFRRTWPIWTQSSEEVPNEIVTTTRRKMKLANDLLAVKLHLVLHSLLWVLCCCTWAVLGAGRAQCMCPSLGKALESCLQPAENVAA